MRTVSMSIKYKIVIRATSKSCPDEGTTEMTLREESTYREADKWLGMYVAEMYGMGFEGHGTYDLTHPKSDHQYDLEVLEVLDDCNYGLDEFIQFIKDYMGE